MIRIGINGFGRIGRLVTRILFNTDSNIQLVAINCTMEIEHMQYLYNYDSVHGLWDKPNNSNMVSTMNNELIINNQAIKLFTERDPTKIEWDKYDIDYVIECTGAFTNYKDVSKHFILNKKIKSIIVSAPSNDIPMFVMGVNNKDYNNEPIISNASCTTNCLGPIVKLLNDKYTIVEGLMTTIHATTATQKTVDGSTKKDWRGGRSILNNIIPSSTGAAKAIGKIIPELTGKLNGNSYRVPIQNGSVVDLTIKLEKETNLDDISNLILENKKELNNIIDTTNNELVSSDIIGNSASAILDKKASIMLTTTFFKLVLWYDNEWGYSNRIVDLLLYISKC